MHFTALLAIAAFGNGFAIGLVIGGRSIAYLKTIDGLTRKHIAERIRDYAASNDQVSLRAVMRIVEDK